MKKSLLLLLFAICSLASWAQTTNYDFYDNSTGQTLYYKDEGSGTAVTHPNPNHPDYWGGYTQPTGILTIPNRVSDGNTAYSVAGIGEHAFYGCDDLTNVTIPNSVTSIGDYAFYGCTNLSHIIVPNSVTNIGMEVFRGIDTIYYRGSASGSPWSARVVITTNYTETGDPLVYESPYKTMVVGCDPAATSVTIPSSVTTIGEDAFYGCSGLTSLTIPNSVTSIGNDAFYGVKKVLYCGTAEGAPWGALRAGCFYTEGDFVFADNTKTTLVGYIGAGGRVTIPNAVTTIGDHAFSGCTALTALTIPNSVTTVEDYAFSGCTGLKMVSIGESVTQIGDHSFEGCINVDTMYYNAKNLENTDDWASENYGFQPMQFDTLVIGNKVQSLPEEGFSNQNNLTSVTIPNSVTTIGNSAFEYCMNLTCVTIPNSVTTIGQRAFGFCSGLTSVTIGSSVTTIGGLAFAGCSGFTSVTIPNSVTTIGDGAFSGCSGLTSVTIPNSVTSIGVGAFYGCSGLTSVTIPSSVNTIGPYAFLGVETVIYCGEATGSPWGAQRAYGARRDSLYYKDCGMTIVSGYVEGLASANIPDGVTAIAKNAFLNCTTLTSVTIPESVTSIENHAFEGCTNVTTLHYNATNLATNNIWHNALDSNNSCGFRPMPLQTLVIGDNVETLPQGVFYNQSHLTTLTIPPSVSLIETAAFYRCSNVTTLYYNATNISGLGSNAYDGFRPMKLQTLVIGDNVETLPDNAFHSQTNLTNVSLPNSLTSIGASAFYNDSNLTNLTLPESLISIGASAFHMCTDITTLDFPESLATIGDKAFYYCTSLSTLTIPETLTAIGSSAFSYCKGLTSVSLPESMTSISDGVFQGCTRLSNITLPNAVTTIGGNAFRDCTALTDISIPSSVTAIGDNAFMGCSALTHISLPNSITIIENNTFNGCSALTDITIPQSVATIDIHAFEGCSALTHVTIPNSVTTIGVSAFQNCTGIASVVIGKSVNTIGDVAFEGCTSLKTVYNLSKLNIQLAYAAFDYGYVAYYANRVLDSVGDLSQRGFTNYGAGGNALHQINNNIYTVVNEENDIRTNIPRSTIPANFIYYDGVTDDNASGWRANEIVLTDDTCRFNSPVLFIADTASYSRSFTNGNRSTLYLPFSAPIPDGFEVYAFSNYDNSNNTLNFAPVADNIQAYTPYLVGYGLSKAEHTTCTITATDVRFPASMTFNYHPASSNGMTFQGTTARTCMSGTNYGYSNGFFVRSGNGSVHSAHAHVNPFRAYFSFTGAPDQMPPVTLGVGFDSSPLGIETPEAPSNSTSSIRYSNDVYDLMGRLVRRDAHTLLGLPNGIYIWRGQKLLHRN